MDALVRYWLKVDRSDPDGCWPWTACRTADGYGQLHVDGSTVSAHRFGYRWTVGEIPAGQDVLHTCDNPPCQRPDHWFTGTRSENNADKFAKGRQSHRLTQSEVDAIRVLSAMGEMTHVQLAASFGVSRVHISNIVRRVRRSRIC